ncbi:hypothetical protein MBLNU457_g0950t1 [Dothideomycetes sp. NU457]
MSFTTRYTTLALRRAASGPRASITPRTFTSTACVLQGPPPPHNPPSGAGRSSHVSGDKQSSASQHEHKTGDDHPAKQADKQPAGDRSTATDTTPSVKEGTDARIDKQSQKVKEKDVGGTNS